MARDDDRPLPVVGKTALAAAYVCFILAAAMIGTSIYVLPLGWKVKLFLSLAVLLLSTMFGFMAVAAHLVARPAPKARSPGDAPGDPR